ncbi:uncharacterized protein LOC115630536 [Scaptodrosophila lebanonensis]|uniref:Uncharacterized protein LOC115630536 n=1 Tax=Drosophila lebanonensis TaxID=7225 RepID=A0A6J2U4Y7_DROLE|nr:uncharacterized protein LOC115630536 [Scaptodrosophila lebanonensis]
MGLGFAELHHVDWPQRPLSWWQRQYYQTRWHQRMRFTTTPRPGATPEWHELRMVYPCYCYKPDKDSNTEQYEKFLVENKDIFILNK